MIEAVQFVEAARERGFEWYAGVPCSYLTPFINYVVQDDSLHYVSAANEGDAVAFIGGVTQGAQNGVRGIDDDAELGPRQRREPADLADVDVPPAATADRDVARPARRRRRTPARADGPGHAGHARRRMEIPWELFPTEADATSAPRWIAPMAHMDAHRPALRAGHAEGQRGALRAEGADAAAGRAPRPRRRCRMPQRARRRTARARHDALARVIAHTPVDGDRGAGVHRLLRPRALRAR